VNAVVVAGVVFLAVMMVYAILESLFGWEK
jgi:hypothetical protein